MVGIGLGDMNGLDAQAYSVNSGEVTVVCES